MTKYIKIIFTISLLLNLLLIGLVGAGAYKKHQWHKGKFSDNPNIKAVVQKNMENNKGQFRDSMKEMRDQINILKDIIEAEEFDMTKYDDQVSKIISGKNEMAEMKARAMGQALAELSYEERQEFSRHVIKSLVGRGKKSPREYDIRKGDKPSR